MDKRLSRADYLLTLVFIFMLVVAVGAFFYGWNMGVQRTTAKFVEAEAKAKTPAVPTAYQQQVLVSFYHTIYQPYRQFSAQWFDDLNQLQTHGNELDASAMFNQLQKTANNSFGLIREVAMPDTSPKLVDAQNAYMKSLKLFSEAIRNFQGRMGEPHGRLLSDMQNDPYFKQAIQDALAAQDSYYQAIVQWNLTVNPSLKGLPVLKAAEVTFPQWKQLNLNEKNQLVADYLMQDNLFEPFYVQDATLRIQDLISSGRAGKLGVANVRQALNLLVETHAVRTGDFLAGKSEYFGRETLPQLPFFFSS